MAELFQLFIFILKQIPKSVFMQDFILICLIFSCILLAFNFRRWF